MFALGSTTVVPFRGGDATGDCAAGCRKKISVLSQHAESRRQHHWFDPQDSTGCPVCVLDVLAKNRTGISTSVRRQG